MTWTTRNRDQYVLTLTDGYVRRGGATAREADIRDLPFEQAMADRLHRFGRELHMPQWMREELMARGWEYPSVLQVWVVGSPGWLARGPPTILHRLAKGDRDTDYRAVVVGLAASRAYASHWASWVRQAGLARVKRHPDAHDFDMAAGAVLEPMLAAYQAGHVAPDALRHLGVPVAYRGDTSASHGADSGKLHGPV